MPRVRVVQLEVQVRGAPFGTGSRIMYEMDAASKPTPVNLNSEEKS
jgi:hypothetical protein